MITDRARSVLGVYAACVCAFAVLPVVAIVAESFTATNYLVFPPVGFSTRWYRAIFDRPEFIQSAWVSLVVAAGASVASTALGTLCAIALVRFEFLGRQALQSLFMAPLSLPGLILGLALLQFFAVRNLPRDLTALMIGHVIVTMPFAIRFVTVALTGMNASVELAAQSLGADRLTTFLKVTLPLIQAGIVASLVFTFILSFDDVAVSLFLSSANATTLPVRIYTYIDQNYDPLVTAVSALIVFAAFLALALVERIIGVGRLFGLR
ncbi:MAG: potC2 [Enterovirga sp.]|jgi:putative spermidine/putrescine transport system permease protein|nr:potC2 [Enterovirga sp.]